MKKTLLLLSLLPFSAGAQTLAIDTDVPVVMTDAGLSQIDLMEPEPLSAGCRSDGDTGVDEAQYGEWYVETAGKFSCRVLNPFSVVALNGLRDVDVTIFRRDDINDADHSQLKVSGMIVGYDVVFHWIPSTGELYWDRQMTGVPVPERYIMEGGYEFIGINSVQKGESTRNRYTPGVSFVANDFWLLLTETLGFSTSFSIAPASAVEVQDALSLNTDVLYEGNQAVISLQSINDIKQAGYLLYGISSDGMYAVLGKGKVSYSELNEYLADLPNILNPGESADITFDLDGIYYLYAKIETVDGRSIYKQSAIYVINCDPDGWEPMGTAQYREGVYGGLVGFKLSFADTDFHPVELQRNIADHNIYRLVNPYNVNYRVSGSAVVDDDVFGLQYTVTFDDQHDYYLVFDITKPYNVTSSGFTAPYILSYLDVEQRMYSEFSGGYYLYGQEIFYNGSDTSEKYGIVLPMENKFVMTASSSGRLAFSDIATDVSAVYYSVNTSGSGLTTDDVYESVASAISEGVLQDGVRMIESACVDDLDWSGLAYKGQATAMAFAVDADGEVVQSQALDFVFEDLDDLDDLVLLGQSVYTDGIISSTFSNVPAYSYEVDTYVSPRAPGYYFLRDVYTNGSWSLNGSGIYTDQSYTRDMEIDCTNPDEVSVNHFYLGINLGYGSCMLYSRAVVDPYLARENGWFGTLQTTEDGDVIAFPSADAFYLMMGEDFYRTNTDGRFSVYLPKGSGGVDGVMADDGSSDEPKVYYNLQGIQVSNPEHGIFIMRQGGKSSKVVIP